jgi:hypothetical protein
VPADRRATRTARLVQHHGSGHDGHGIAQQRCEPGHRECSTGLVAELEQRRPDAIPGNEGEDEDVNGTAGGHDLGRHVADREEEPACDAERRGSPKRLASDREKHEPKHGDGPDPDEDGGG